ncbi:protein PERCC1-like [Lineus longissimus]|uniref:protein PERCC1-like n=1 Tax=Lineus longissimus TaxID=88925 RepID=UPI00315D8146
MDLSMTSGGDLLQVETYVFEDTDSDFTDDSMEDFLPYSLVPKDADEPPSTEARAEKCPDVPSQLLGFADHLTKDVQKCFHDPRGSIYDITEDDHTKKSGRELYYAELLKLARGYEAESAPKSKRRVPDEVTTKSGDLGIRLGNDLGPLDDLFNEVGTRGVAQTVPMEERKLPQSFWQEPLVKEANICKDVEGVVRDEFGLQEDHTVFIGTDVKELLSLW